MFGTAALPGAAEVSAVRCTDRVTKNRCVVPGESRRAWPAPSALCTSLGLLAQQCSLAVRAQSWHRRRRPYLAPCLRLHASRGAWRWALGAVLASSQQPCACDSLPSLWRDAAHWSLPPDRFQPPAWIPRSQPNHTATAVLGSRWPRGRPTGRRVGAERGKPGRRSSPRASVSSTGRNVDPGPSLCGLCATSHWLCARAHARARCRCCTRTHASLGAWAAPPGPSCGIPRPPAPGPPLRRREPRHVAGGRA